MKINMQKTKATSLSLIMLLSSSILILTVSAKMEKSPGASSEAKVHIIYTERPKEGVDPESFHIKTLASVCGSEKAAKAALLYSYKDAASGFSAKLTPKQANQLSKQPGVLEVVPSQKMQLHSGPEKFNV